MRRNQTMSTQALETPFEVLGSRPNEGAVKFQEQIIPDDRAEVLDQGPGEREILHDAAPEAIELEPLTSKKQHWGFLEGKDASLFISLSSVPTPKEKPIDIPSLQSQLSSLLPRDRQLERRARKLAWHLSKGRHVTCEWDNVFLSELTPAESCMSDDAFAALYPDKVKTPTRKGGRPRKYRTAKARERGHAECQRRYRDRKPLVVGNVTKPPSQLAEN
jgi:hypothetical protein